MQQRLAVTSTLFTDSQAIPKSAAHTAVGGENVSPYLAWTGVPDGVKSFAVTCHDPDAPTGIGFVHWVLANLDARTTALPAGSGAAGRNPAGSVLGFTDWGESAYGGTAPPAGHGPHRYNFTVLALDVEHLDVDQTTTYAKLRFMAWGHVLAAGTITGLFEVPA